MFGVVGMVRVVGLVVLVGLVGVVGVAWVVRVVVMIETSFQTRRVIFDSSGTYNGMDITFSGGDDTVPVSESFFIPAAVSFTAVRVCIPPK